MSWRAEGTAFGRVQQRWRLKGLKADRAEVHSRVARAGRQRKVPRKWHLIAAGGDPSSEIEVVSRLRRDEWRVEAERTRVECKADA